MTTVTTRAIVGRDARILELLVEGHGVRETARIVGCGRMVVSRRMQRPEFRRALADAEREARGLAVRRIRASAPIAVAALVEIVQDPEVSPSVRVMAAGRLLRAVTILEPKSLDLAVAEYQPQPDISNAHEALKDMLDGIAERRAATTPRALAAHSDHRPDGQILGGNGVDERG
jgi:hypothetical protein